MNDCIGHQKTTVFRTQYEKQGRSSIDFFVCLKRNGEWIWDGPKGGIYVFMGRTLGGPVTRSDLGHGVS